MKYLFNIFQIAAIAFAALALTACESGYNNKKSDNDAALEKSASDSAVQSHEHVKDAATEAASPSVVHIEPAPSAGEAAASGNEASSSAEPSSAAE